MIQLLESIRCKDGKLEQLDFHQQRVNRSFEHFFQEYSPIQLQDIVVPEHVQFGVYKCRLIYTEQVETILFTPYKIRPINSLKIIVADDMDYHYKYADRKPLEKLYKNRAHADDILIIKNGLITDTYYANVALFDGKKWHTPSTPLLQGTRRASLIQSGQITPSTIKLEELQDFSKIRLFNAMMPFEEGPLLSVSEIDQ